MRGRWLLLEKEGVGCWRELEQAQGFELAPDTSEREKGSSDKADKFICAPTPDFRVARIELGVLQGGRRPLLVVCIGVKRERWWS